MRYEVEIKDVDVEWASGGITTAKLLIWEEDPSDAKLVKLSLRFDGREITSSDEDYFSAPERKISMARTRSWPGFVAHPERYIIHRKDGLIHVILSRLNGATNAPAATA